MVHSRGAPPPTGRRPEPPQGAAHGRMLGGEEASAPRAPKGACGPRGIRRICPQFQPFSALLRTASGSTPDPLATTLGVALTGPISRPAHRPPRVSLSLEKPLARGGKPVGDLGVQRSFYVDDLGSSQHPNPGLHRPLDRCSYLLGYHQDTHTGPSPFNVVVLSATHSFSPTYSTTPLRSPQFRVPLTVMKNLSKGTMGKTLQPSPFPHFPLRGLPA